MSFKWPLNISNFTWLDRLKICSFFLNPNSYWTMGKEVKEYERRMSEFVGSNFSVFVSSGSTANTILAMYLKDKLVESGEFATRNVVVLPSTTWTTSCSPWIREGFVPYFIDVSLDNFAMDLSKLNEYLKENEQKVACVFPTCLLGFNIDYKILLQHKKSFPKVHFFIDECENNFGGYADNNGAFRMLTSTTSTYFGHELQSVEGGFIFTENVLEYQQFLMLRNHGMTRSLEKPTFDIGYARESGESSPASKFENSKVDSRFDFYCFGNNFRNSDIHAKIGLLDLKRVYKYIAIRRKLYNCFRYTLNNDRYLLPKSTFAVPFCLPIICKGDSASHRLNKIKLYCIENKIETRPIISGFLGYQTAYQGLMNEKDYPNSIYLHNNGIYIGLHTKLKEKQILKLTEFLNKI